MSNKHFLDDKFKSMDYAYWRAPNPSGMGRYRFPVVPLHYDEDVLENNQMEDVHRMKSQKENDDSITDEEAKLLRLESRADGSHVWRSRIDTPFGLFSVLIGSKRKAEKQFKERFPGIAISFIDPKSRQDLEGDITNQPPLRRIWNPDDNALIILEHETSRRLLSDARTSLESAISSQLSTLPYTHFVSLPLVSEEVEAKVLAFKEKCMNLSKPLRNGLNESYFISPGRLHFTLCMLRLYYSDEIERAREALRELSRTSSNELFKSGVSDTEESLPPGLHVRLQGVYTMGEDESKACIVYTKEASESDVTITKQNKTQSALSMRDSAQSNILQLCRELYQCLCEKDVLTLESLEHQHIIVSPDWEVYQLLLHATLIKSRVLENSSAQENFEKYRIREPHQRPTFDASTIQKCCQNFDFGCVQISSLHLSSLIVPSDEDVSCTQYYRAEIVIPIRPGYGL